MHTSTAIEPSGVTSRSEILKAIADPTRIEILDMVSEGACCNCELQAHLDLAPNLLSYHLRVLREAGLIVGARRGRWIDYDLAPHAAATVAASLPSGLQT